MDKLQLTKFDAAIEKLAKKIKELDSRLKIIKQIGREEHDRLYDRINRLESRVNNLENKVNTLN